MASLSTISKQVEHFDFSYELMCSNTDALSCLCFLAADRGEPGGVAGLGSLYLFGLGVEQNNETAHKYLAEVSRVTKS